MSRFPLLTSETAPEVARSALETAQRNNGYLPNLLRVLANAPVALETYLTVGGINARSKLTLAERETIQITAAATHGCGFCVAGHTAIAYKKAGLDETVVEALRALAPVSDPKLAAVAEFTKAVIATRGRVPDEGLKAFLEAGYTEENALEVVLGVSLATLCNFANNLAQPPLNDELSQYRWEGPAPVAK